MQTLTLKIINRLFWSVILAMLFVGVYNTVLYIREGIVMSTIEFELNTRPVAEPKDECIVRERDLTDGKQYS